VVHAGIALAWVFASLDCQERSNARCHVYRRYGHLLSNGCMSLAATGCREEVMTLEYILGAIVSVVIMVYLIYALLWPEKF
jgi:K+-transporting ATPase KdpF subunit